MRRTADGRRLRRLRDASPPRRFELDRTWLLRGILVVVAIALLMLIAKVSMMAVGSGNQRLERLDPSSRSGAALTVRAIGDAAAR
jgi:hypothetical protein